MGSGCPAGRPGRLRGPAAGSGGLGAPNTCSAGVGGGARSSRFFAVHRSGRPALPLPQSGKLAGAAQIGVAGGLQQPGREGCEPGIVC